jgi:hypothetical protein
LKKEVLKMTLETVEKRFKLGDYDGSTLEQIKSSLKPPLLINNNTNGLQQQLPAGFNINHPLFKQHIDKHGNMDKHIATLLQQHKLKQQQMLQQQLQQQQQQQQLQQQQALSNKNKRFKKDNVVTATVAPLKANTSASSSSSLLSSDNLANIKSNMSSKLLQQQQLHSTKNNKITVNNGALRPPLALNSNGQQQRLSTGEFAKSLNNTDSANNKRRINMMLGNRPDAAATATTESCSAAVVNPVDASLLNELKEYTQYAEELRRNDIENLDSMLAETKNRLSTSVDTDGHWCFKRKDGCKYLAVSFLLISFVFLFVRGLGFMRLGFLKFPFGLTFNEIALVIQKQPCIK